MYAPKPTNLRLRGATHVDSDLYNICTRVKEVDPNLFIVYHPDHPLPFVVMESCADGEDRYVKRYETLDARILDDLRYMLRVPFDERLKRLNKEIEEHNAQANKMDPEKFERFAYEFDRAARRSNMYDPIWVKNMPLAPAKR